MNIEIYWGLLLGFCCNNFSKGEGPDWKRKFCWFKAGLWCDGWPCLAGNDHVGLYEKKRRNFFYLKLAPNLGKIFEKTVVTEIRFTFNFGICTVWLLG